MARLTAGAGLKYLLKTTMQADLIKPINDATSYYAKAGTPQGRWLGQALTGIDRQQLQPVTAAEAKAVFSLAQDPDTQAILGRPHSQTTVASRSGERQQRDAVAGFDLTFSVPKSVSVLWAVADNDVRQQILDAHHRAVSTVLAWLEQEAIHTRTGRNGVAHVGTKGAIAAAFDHWESRAGDPQLHTHLVIANRVQRRSDDAWATIDSRALFKAVVAASEHYNGLLFDELRRSLGTEADFRSPTAVQRNPSHELSGVDTALIMEFSNRSRLIGAETDRLTQNWTYEHGKKPTATTIIKLRQIATLSTRQAKDESPTPLDELRVSWRDRARAAGQNPGTVVERTIHRSRQRPVRASDLSPAWVDSAAALTRDGVARRRATWNRWNLLAEADRTCADIRCHSSADRRFIIDAVTAAAESQSVPLSADRYRLPVNAAEDLAYAGNSAFDFPGARLYTDASTLANEQLIMQARHDGGGPAARSAETSAQLTTYRHRAGYQLTADQLAAALAVLTSGNRLDAIVGPAGSGKTTTMAAIKAVWEEAHGAGSVVGLAPAAASAGVLARELGITAENIAKWLYESLGQGANNRADRFRALESTPRGKHGAVTTQLARLSLQQSLWQFKKNQLIIVDEASMVSTIQLAGLVHQARDVGAKLLLVVDPAQLDAIDAGGMLGWLHRDGKAVELTSIHRFTHDWEGPASLQLREGNIDAVNLYAAHGRIQHGDFTDVVENAYAAWAGEQRDGKSSILIAPDNDTVTTLNERAHAAVVESGIVDAEHTVALADGLTAGRGDIIIARKNNRKLTDSNGDYLRNGTLLRIAKRPHRDGTITARRVDTGATITLDAVYLSTSAELGYATTAHRSQGITVDTSHIVLTQGCLTRELFYVGMTRGRNSNTVYVCESNLALDEPHVPVASSSWRQILGEVLAAEGAERTAHEVRESESAKADTLQRLAAEYDYLAQLAAAEHLTSVIAKLMPDVVTHLHESPSWGAGVAVWRHAHAINPAAAQRVLDGALRPPGDAQDHMAVIHARLRRVTGDGVCEPLGTLNEQLFTERPDLQDMLDQVRTRTINRRALVARMALMDRPAWVQRLQATMGATIPADHWAAVISDVAAYRDRWDIETYVDPLGPVPSNYEWEQTQERAGLQRQIEFVLHVNAGAPGRDQPTLPVPVVHKPLTAVGPSL
ncbi:MobF family relaxase [Arthrobacter wenxiniae]|jgi:conjugative relaxase-like TrwC/TraI family protein|uniref:Relaxase domain-containing protein n=1 Tax=Arthrobacter wenxiniae TaxID=2713570 RepID=A0A7Y7IIZ6_9MICC|nr:MobF family relaxase [Arthrobacter wenxiniae]NVM96193.1 relaxase domain-containing protein [Arthrobacter wenxiniae]